MLKNKIPKIKKTKNLTQRQQHSHDLDESDMDFYKNVIDNITPKKVSLRKLKSLGRKMSENLDQNKEIQNCIYINRVKVKSKKSINIKDKQPLKYYKTSLNNKYSAKPTLFNKKKLKKKIEQVRSLKEKKISMQNSKQEEKSVVNSSKNKEQMIWSIIEKMEQDKLENFMEKISKFYDEKFSCNVKQNQDSQEIDDSQMTRKNPLVKMEESKKSDNNQIDKLRVELEEIKTMIKKMNN